jgi:hypothetical protein
MSPFVVRVDGVLLVVVHRNEPAQTKEAHENQTKAHKEKTVRMTVRVTVLGVGLLGLGVGC